MKSWHKNWDVISLVFRFSSDVKKVIYTKNSIENFNRPLRKVTKSKTIFPSDDSLFKSLYLVMMDVTQKWTGESWGLGSDT